MPVTTSARPISAPVGPADDNSENIQSHCTFFLGDRNVMRAHLLTDLVFEPPESSVRSSVSGTLTWRNTKQYLSDFRGFLRQQQDVLDGLRGPRLLALREFPPIAVGNEKMVYDPFKSRLAFGSG